MDQRTKSREAKEQLKQGRLGIPADVLVDM